MKEDNKKEVKRNIITGVSTASGAVVGTIIEDAVVPFVTAAKAAKEPTIISFGEDPQSGSPEATVNAASDQGEPVESVAASYAEAHQEPFIGQIELDAESAIIGVEVPAEFGPSTFPFDAMTDNEVHVEVEAPVEGEVTVDVEAPVGEEAPVETEPAIIGIETHVEEIDGIEVISIENPGEELEIPLINIDPSFVEVAEEEPEYMDNGYTEEGGDEPFGENIIDEDFTETRVEGIGNVGFVSNDIPDYVNNANIDSFMDLG